MLKIVGAFQITTSENPLVAMGTPDPYTPPTGGEHTGVAQPLANSSGEPHMRSIIKPLTSAGRVALIVGLGILSMSLTADASQPKRVPRIGVITFEGLERQIEEFKRGLRELGYVENQNVQIELRSYPTERLDLLPGIASELVRSEADVLVAQSTPEIRALMQATSTIPIVMVGPGDPVGAGLVASLARPGGNVTGVTFMMTGTFGKRLELLKETIGKISRVGVLWNPANPVVRQYFVETQVAAQTLGITIHSVEVREPNEFASAFSSIAKARDGGLIVILDPLMAVHKGLIIDFAAREHVPSMSNLRVFVEAGGLMSYGVNPLWNQRRAATYVAKILRGAKPADLPVEQPTKFELVINMKTAKALGLTIPQSILARADEVIP
jgi:putative ABC transport system substrate-binding protein